MKKERMLRIRRGAHTGDYYLEFLNGETVRGFCEKLFEKFCPSLKIKRRDIQKVRLTQLKNGIKLEKVGKPIKG